MVNSDTNEKNILKKEYEEKYLDKFVKINRGGYITYFKVSDVDVKLYLVEFEEGNMVQAKVILWCRNFI